MTFQQYNIYPGFTPVRLASTANIAGTYFNGQTNNGVGATLTIAAASLTIDGVLCEEGDRVLLQTQTNTNETGIYIVESIGATVILKRAADMQCIEQIIAGQFVSVGAGSVSAGNIFSIVEPLPAHFGVDALVINADPSAGGVAFSGGASTANAIAVFSNASGDIKAADAAPVTLGQNLSVTGTITSTGTITTSAGNIVVTAGTITASGNLSITAGTITASGNISSSAGLILERAVNGLTALAGGAQAGTALTGQINRVTTVVTAADSVQLPLATAGKVITVINAAAANAMAVFPQTGEIINALAANASISVAANKTITFYCAIAGTWNSLLTA